MFKILTLNNISVRGLERLARDKYEVASEIQNPDAVLVRSADMHKSEIPATVKAIGRAGAGVNNIPVGKMSERGIPVFNAPGANANAVKELVVAGMLMACRNIAQSLDFARKLEGDDAALHKLTEAGKKDFAGFEIAGRTLGVIGLGAIGREIANAAISLGMRVVGFDPGITVEGAWRLSSQVEQARSVDDLISRVDFVTFHVPLLDSTKKMLNAARVGMMRPSAVVLNFAREGIVDDEAVVDALNKGKLYAYVCDFPTNLLKNHPRVVTLPHLGASTVEAEDNCAVMVADQIRDYLENGNVRNSVNFPEVIMSRAEGHRIAVVNANVPNMVGQISTAMAKANLNIIDMLNKSKGELAYTLIDINSPCPDAVVKEIRTIKGVLGVRCL